MVMQNRTLISLLSLCLSAGMVAASGAIGHAQESNSAASKHACAVRATGLSPGDIAMANANYAKAVEAYDSEMRAGGSEGTRARNGNIRALLAAGRIDEAEGAAKAWLAAAPADVWASTSLAEVQLRKGEIAAALATLKSAQSADSCNARINADLARVYAFAANFASAKSTIDTAHALDPIDDGITLQWIESEPYQAQMLDLDGYIAAAASYLSEDRKSELMHRRKRLSLALSDNCKLMTPAAKATIPYYFVQNGVNAQAFWSLQVKIDGKTLRLSEDSKVSGILLKKSVAEDAHLEVVDETGVGTSGAVTASAARVKKIEIGPLEFANCDVQVAKDDMKVYGETAWEVQHNTFLDRGSDGLIGVDAFRDFLVTLDKPGRQFKIEPLPGPASGELHLVTGVAPEAEPLHDRFVDPSMQGWTKGFRTGRFFLYPVRLNGGPVGLYSLATNSILNSISLETARQLGNVNPNGKELPSMSGHNGQYFRTSDVTLEFLGMKEHLIFMSAEDMTGWSQDHGIQITGFLGGRPMLDQFTLHLDYRDDLLKLDFDPKRVVHCPPNIRMPGCY
jgi:tetratricopeptide (TPR) repeat protein